jgi:hypothetical protein
MTLLPYRRYQADSGAAPSAVEDALRASVEPRRMVRLGAGTLPFEGEVGAGVFEVQRIIGYRNSFLPRIRGTIAPSPEGSRVTVTMRLHPTVFVFMTVWLCFAGIGCAVLVVAALRGTGSAYQPLGPALMFVLGWAMVSGGFFFEARRAERLLADIMSARPGASAVQPRVAADGAAPRR